MGASNSSVQPCLRGAISTLRQPCRSGGQRWRHRSIRAAGIAGSRAASRPASGAAAAPLWRCRSAATGRFPAGATRLGSGSRHVARKGLDCHHSWTEWQVLWITRPITPPPQTLSDHTEPSQQPASAAAVAAGNRPRPGCPHASGPGVGPRAGTRAPRLPPAATIQLALAAASAVCGSMSLESADSPDRAPRA